MANLIAIDALLPVQEDLRLNSPVDAAAFPLRAALLRDQRVVGPTLPEPVIILEEGLPVGVMKPGEVGGKAALRWRFCLTNSYSWTRHFHLLTALR